MTHRSALPGLATGMIGLIVGLIGYSLKEPSLAAVAGICALASGVAGLRITQQFKEQAAVQNLIEKELDSIRKDSERAEATLEELKTSEPTTKPTAPETQKDLLLDPSTGLFTQNFFEVALESRIASARRHLRPISVILLEVVSKAPGEKKNAQTALVAETIKKTIREADTACLLKKGYFTLMLEDTPENGAIWTVERIRRSLTESTENLTVWAGIACYPAHAFTGEELLTSADEALEAAREWQQGRIEVAATAPE